MVSFVAGLIPSLSGRSFLENLPKPIMFTSPSSISPFVIPELKHF